ncbi:hypothetical protein DL770_003626 [Monosporascus sp. CRB-9-2]|nr:hypothetical protein DL770_003626 [Monosporascus sp. CRB-9-2]
MRFAAIKKREDEGDVLAGPTYKRDDEPDVLVGPTYRKREDEVDALGGPTCRRRGMKWTYSLDRLREAGGRGGCLSWSNLLKGEDEADELAGPTY